MLRQAILLIGLLTFSLRGAENSQSTPHLSHPLDIRPQKISEWEASEPDIKAVLNSAAHELWIYFPKRELPPILVSAQGGPITLFERGPNGEIRIMLNTKKTFWAQYAFQFSHEMCHVLCGFRKQENPNHWFEESLCETASLFTLHAMSKKWVTNAPYKNWQSYSVSLKAYADERIAQGKVPEGRKFVDWFGENEPDMRKNSVDRARNNVVAGMLLPLFEAEPEHWEAAGWLNTEDFNKFFTLKAYLQAWRRNSPEKHRSFIDKVAEVFELKLDKE